MTGKQIKKIRQEANLTQEEFGKKIFHTKSTISKWENNIQTPDIKTLKEISKVFGVELSELLNDADSPTVNESKKIIVWNKSNYSGMSDLPSPKWISLLKVVILIIGLSIAVGGMIPLIIHKDQYTKQDLITLFICLVVGLLFMVAWGIYYKVTLARAVTKRFNITTEIYNNKLVIKSKKTNNIKTINNIKNITKKSAHGEMQIEIELHNNNSITLFKVDDSVFKLLNNMKKGEKYE